MSFIGAMFSNSNGSGYDATAQQEGALGKASADQAEQLGQVNQSLQDQAEHGSTLAQNQLTKATGENIQNASGMIASQKGLNPALAARLAAQQAGTANQTAANESAQLQTQTQMAAKNALSNNLLGQQQVYQGAIANQNNAQKDIALGNQKAQQGILGGVMNAAGAAISDARQKTNIHSGDQDSKQFLDSIKSHSYEYKNPTLPGAGPGEHTSPMAQELEKSSSGAQMVIDTPNGKMVDYAKGLPAMTAALAYLNKKVESLEGRKHMAEGGAVNPTAAVMPPVGNVPQVSGPRSAAARFMKGFQNAMTPSGQASGLDLGASNLGTALGKTAHDAIFRAPADPQNISPTAAPNAVVQPGALPTSPPPTTNMAEGGDVAKTIEAGSPSPKSTATGEDALFKGTSALASGIIKTAMANGGKVEDKKAKIKAIIDAHMKANMQSLQPQSATMAGGGKVPVMLSPGERYLSPNEAKAAKEGKVEPIRAGKKVPGKPTVGGAKNDYANDTFATTAEAGGLVLPRSVTQAKDPGEAARKFVQAHMAKGGKVLPGKKKAK